MSVPEDEFRTLYRRTYGFVLTKAQAILRDEAESMDVAQEVFLEAWRSWAKLETHPTRIGWLLQAATHRAIDRLRHRRRVTRHARDERPPEANDPRAELELGVIFTTVLEGESEMMKRVVAHTLLDGTTQEETALLLSVSRKTVQRHLDRFRAKCRALIPGARMPAHG